MSLSFGYNTGLPQGRTVAWGARLIVDQGGHSSTSLVALLQGDDQQDSVAFCADRGLYAMQYAGGAGASVIKP